MGENLIYDDYARLEICGLSKCMQTKIMCASEEITWNLNRCMLFSQTEPRSQDKRDFNTIRASNIWPCLDIRPKTQISFNLSVSGLTKIQLVLIMKPSPQAFTLK